MKELIDKDKTLNVLTELAKYFAYKDLPSVMRGIQIAIETIKTMKPENEKNFPKSDLWDEILTSKDTDGDFPHEENLQTVLYKRMNE